MIYILYFILACIGEKLYGTVFLGMRNLNLLTKKKNLGLVPNQLYNCVKSSGTDFIAIMSLLSIVYTIILYSIYNDTGIKIVMISLVFSIFGAFSQDPELNIKRLCEACINKSKESEEE